MNRVVLCAGILAISCPALAGELAPPAGPVTSTMKDLLDVEPRVALRNDFDTLTPIVIQFPGSYYLAENVDAFFGQHGIEILASNVTLDLNGFRILGNTEVGSLDGIHVDFGAGNTTIKNGTIELFFGDGIDAQDDLTLIDVRLINNGILNANGVRAGARAIIHRCAAIGSGSRGFLLGGRAVVTESIATGSTLGGFVIGPFGSMRGCVAESNGDDGFFLSSAGTAENCVARSNAGHGFDANGECVFSNCVAFANMISGFDPNSGSVITGCSAYANAMHGINAGSNNIIRGNTFSNNTAGNGINISGSGNLIEHNACSLHTANLAAGIQIDGDGNRIDSNHASRNFNGIILGGTQNFMIRNTAQANTNFEFGAAFGNSIGAIVNSSPSAAGPWDNFTN